MLARRRISKLMRKPLKSAEEQSLVEAADVVGSDVVFEASLATVALARHLDCVNHGPGHAAGHHPHDRAVDEVQKSFGDGEVRW